MTEEKAVTSRRDFLKLAGTAVPAAAVAVAIAPEAAVASDAAPGKGMQKTKHVQAYLDSARF
jgi:hypothetical protein